VGQDNKLAAVTIGKAIGQVLLCALFVFLGLYSINSGKAVFPTAFVVIVLLTASLLQQASLAEAILRSGVRRVTLGAGFLLVVLGVPVSQSWREYAYILPMVVALVILVFSANSYLQRRLESRHTTKR
jgi:hypothetical protein